MNQSVPAPLADTKQYIDFIHYLQYGVQAEMRANCNYRKDSHLNSDGVTIIRHYCRWGSCSANFTFEMKSNQYRFVNGHHFHNHVGEPPSFKYSPKSIFLRPYLQQYFISGGKVADAISCSYQALNIPFINNYVFFSYDENTLRQLKKELTEQILQMPKGSNHYGNFLDVVNKYKSEKINTPSAKDLLYHEIDDVDNPVDFLFVYGDCRIKDLLYEEPRMYHIDSTFKILFEKLVLYIIACKFEKTHVIPLCYFIVKQDNETSISKCLIKFFEWFERTPSNFMSDCALQIFNSIHNTFQECNIFWCALHVMRALRKNLYRIPDENIRADVDKYMNILCYTMPMNMENANQLYEKIIKLILPYDDFNNYFQRQWAKHKEQWISAFKEDSLTLVNNISESLFKNFKYYEFGNVKNLAIDKFVFLLLNRVKENYFLRIQQDINLHQIVLPPRNCEIPEISNYDKQKTEIQSKIQHLSNLLKKGEMYLLPLLKELNTLVTSFETMTSIRQNAIIFWSSHGVEGDLMTEVLEYIDKICSENSLYEVIDNWNSIVNDINSQIGIEDQYEI